MTKAHDSNSTDSFFNRNYKAIITAFLAIIVTLAFYTGYLQGKREGGLPVTLSCSDSVLQQLAIPAAIIAQGKTSEDTKKAITSTSATATPSKTIPAQGKYLASKNGTKYYTPTCSGAKRIKEENRIWFNSAEDAILQGYSAAKC